MTHNFYTDVKEFHKTFGQRVGKSPELPSKEERDLRKKLLAEEMSALVEQLFASTNPSYSPNGEIISRQLNEAEIGQLIG